MAENPIDGPRRSHRTGRIARPAGRDTPEITSGTESKAPKAEPKSVKPAETSLKPPTRSTTSTKVNPTPRARVIDVQRQVEDLESRFKEEQKLALKARYKSSRHSGLIVRQNAGLVDLKQRIENLERQLRSAESDKSSTNPVIREIGARTEADILNSDDYVKLDVMADAFKQRADSFHEEYHGENGIITKIERDVKELKGHFEDGGRVWQAEEGINSLHKRTLRVESVVKTINKVDWIPVIAGLVVGVIVLIVVQIILFINPLSFTFNGEKNTAIYSLYNGGVGALLWGILAGVGVFFFLDMFRSRKNDDDTDENREVKYEDIRVESKSDSRSRKEKPSSLPELVADNNGDLDEKFAGLTPQERFELLFDEEFEKLVKPKDQLSKKDLKAKSKIAIERASQRAAAYIAAQAAQPNETEEVTAGATQGSRV